MKKTFVSIIIPTYNEEKYLEKTLRALENQDCKEKYEIIVADGGSKDKTLKIAERHKTKIVITKKRGIAIGRNAGAKVAKGEILIFIDSDTVPNSSLIKSYVKVFKDKEILAATGPLVPLTKRKTNKKMWETLYKLYNKLQYLSIKMGKPVFCGCNSAYRKRIFKEVGGFPDKFPAEDSGLSLIVAKFGKTEFSNDAYVYTSLRRYEKMGLLNCFWFYFLPTIEGVLKI